MEWIFIVLIIVLAISYAVSAFKRKTRRLAQQLFQTDSLLDGYQHQMDLLAETPKSVSDMTRIYLPQIARDFPEFHYGEFKMRAQGMLLSAFSAISQQNIERLQYASPLLEQAVAQQIFSNQQDGKTENYSDVKIHAMAINGYQKQGGTCTITLQCAVAHDFTIYENGVLIAGDANRTTQSKYNIDLVYVQDVSKLQGSMQTAYTAANCPNCGAPISNLGDKFCPYCGSAVKTVNIHIWQIHQYTRL